MALLKIREGSEQRQKSWQRLLHFYKKSLPAAMQAKNLLDHVMVLNRMCPKNPRRFASLQINRDPPEKPLHLCAFEMIVAMIDTGARRSQQVFLMKVNKCISLSQRRFKKATRLHTTAATIDIQDRELSQPTFSIQLPSNQFSVCETGRAERS